MGAPPQLLLTHKVWQRDAVTLIVRSDWAAALPVEAIIGGAPPRAWGDPVAHDLRGRGAVSVLATPKGEIVVKALGRGGVLGGLLRNSYLDRWRPAREAVVAEQLAARGCATPPVVLARITRVAPALHRLEVATARVAGALDLADALAAGTSARSLAAAAGAAVRRLHDAGLRHRDLHLKNLVTGGEAGGAVRVLDLDRSRLGTPLSLAERLASLGRLGRSAVKLGVVARPGGVAACRAFFRAYGPLGGPGPGAAAVATGAGGGEVRPGTLMRRAVSRVRRSWRWHRLLWPRQLPGTAR